MSAVAFGVQGSGPLVGGVPDRSHFERVARAAEDGGFDSLWAGDHVAFHHPLVDVTVALATFAALTERIGLGAGVLLLPLRAPALVAREFASLDYLSGGRVILGVGVGGESAKDFEAVGVPKRERGARTDEGLVALRRLFADGRASLDGRFSRFHEIAIEPRAAQAGGPPLWVGGRSEAALRRAAAIGDGWIPVWISPEKLAEGLASIGSQAGDRRVTGAVVLPALVDGTVEEARAYLSRRYATEFTTHAIERYCLTGPPGRIAARIHEYVDAGAEHVVLHPAAETAGLVGQIERLAEVVAAAR